jgi:hypothetical protein
MGNLGVPAAAYFERPINLEKEPSEFENRNDFWYQHLLYLSTKFFRHLSLLHGKDIAFVNENLLKATFPEAKDSSFDFFVTPNGISVR